jgi:hypothetical protein
LQHIAVSTTLYAIYEKVWDITSDKPVAFNFSAFVENYHHLQAERSHTIKRAIFLASLLYLSFIFSSPVLAQDPIVYPAQGQSHEQMEKDKFQCYTWARDQTGFDPMQTPTTTSRPPQKEEEVWGAGKTGVAGGAGGAVVGGLAGGRSGAVRGGLIGAAGGALIGGMRRSSQRDREDRNREQWEREETNNYVRARNEYNRAFSACMTGRGYTVK